MVVVDRWSLEVVGSRRSLVVVAGGSSLDGTQPCILVVVVAKWSLVVALVIVVVVGRWCVVVV